MTDQAAMSDNRSAAAARVLLTPGDRAPTFNARSPVNPRFRFDSVAGRWLVLGFAGSVGNPAIAARIRAMWAAADVFNDEHASIFAISGDPEDESLPRLGDAYPGRRVFWDDDLAIARAYGVLPRESGGEDSYLPMWIVLDPTLTVHRIVPMRQDGGDVPEVLDLLRRLPPPDRFLGFQVPAPILILPDVFEPAFCDHLVNLYDTNGGTVSGFMRDQDGKTVAVHDKNFKVRRDYTLDRREDIEAAQTRILRRVVPQIERVHFFKCTRMERYMVGCYDAEEGGHFRPHRDNTTLGTAHRRFAVSINLTDDFDGGEVSFPEYGPKGYKGPKGSAVIFSCSLLHAVGQVTRGRRYAFLPFLYDEAAAQIREENARQVPSAENYKA